MIFLSDKMIVYIQVHPLFILFFDSHFDMKSPIKFIRMILIYALFFSCIIPPTQTAYAAVPIINTQPPLMESGFIDAFQTDSSLTLSPSWSSSYTRPLTRIQLTGTQTCSVILGMRGFDVQFGGDPSKVSKMGSEASFSSGSITILITMSNRSNFTFFKINYLSISSALTEMFVIKQLFTVNNPLSSTSSKVQTRTYTTLPPIGLFTQYQVYISIFSMKLAYHNNGKTGMQIKIESAFTTPNIFEFTLSCANSQMQPYIDVIQFYVIITPMDTIDNWQRANVLVRNQIQKRIIGIINEETFKSVDHPKQSSNFVNMLYGFQSGNHRLSTFQFKIGLDSKLNYSAVYTFTEIWTNNFLLYAQTCPINFYYSDNGRQCQRCAQYCDICNPTGTCDRCWENFAISTAFDKCSCVYEVVSNLCYDFDNSPMKYCTTAFNQSTGIECIACKATLYRTIVDNQCQCRPQFQQNPITSVCQQTCGDGLIYDHECDDGNSFDGDGCNSKCKVEENFKCVQTAYSGPSYCWSLIKINFKLISIMKSKDNSAIIELYATGFPLPFGFSPDQFHSQSITMTLKTNLADPVILTLNPLLVDANGNTIRFKIDYGFTIQQYYSELSIDMSQSRYPTSNATMSIKMKGTNFPLVFSSEMEIFQIAQILMMALSILALVQMFVGGISGKFIGLQAAVTMQLIYYSQILINPFDKFPVGFCVFQPLKYVNGYNHIFSVTSYNPKTDMQFKFQYLDIKKSIIEQFNINFGLLLISFLVFLIFCFLTSYHQRLYLAAQYQQLNPVELKSIQTKLKYYLKITTKLYNVVSQISMWCILQLFACCAAQLMISNNNTFLTTSEHNAELFYHFNHPIIFFTIFIITFIGLNSFSNIFLSELTVGKLRERPMELNYKQIFFMYLFFMGFVIMFTNELRIIKIVPMSAIVLLIHVIYLGILIRIDPYKMSLRIHSVGLFTCQGLYTMFLIFINVINFVPSIHDTIILAVIFVIFGFSLFIIIITAVRLYYEHRFGEHLEKEIQKDRELQQKRRIQLQEAQVLKLMKVTYEKAQMNDVNNQQKLKMLALKQQHQNPYLPKTLFENEKKDDLIYWLQNRQNWTQQQKEQYYFRKYKTKPLQWIKRDDPKNYQKIINEQEEQKKKAKEKIQSKKQNPEYEALIKRLNKEFMEKKEKL